MGQLSVPSLARTYRDLTNKWFPSNSEKFLDNRAGKHCADAEENKGLKDLYIALKNHLYMLYNDHCGCGPVVLITRVGSVCCLLHLEQYCASQRLLRLSASLSLFIFHLRRSHKGLTFNIISP